jgi:hypothetical protein
MFRVGTAAWEYGLPHAEANVFQQLEQCLHETGSVTSMSDVNAGSPRAVRTPANQDAAAVERELQRSSRDNVRELGVFQPAVLAVLHEEQYHHSRIAYTIFADALPLLTQLCEPQ